MHGHNRLCSKMAKDSNFARVLKTTLPPTIARKLVTLTPLRSVRYQNVPALVGLVGRLVPAPL